jgi:hypothetical protein
MIHGDSPNSNDNFHGSDWIPGADPNQGFGSGTNPWLSITPATETQSPHTTTAPTTTSECRQVDCSTNFYTDNAVGLADGCCCTSGGSCASTYCDYADWMCKPDPWIMTSEAPSFTDLPTTRTTSTTIPRFPNNHQNDHIDMVYGSGSLGSGFGSSPISHHEDGQVHQHPDGTQHSHLGRDMCSMDWCTQGSSMGATQCWGGSVPVLKMARHGQKCGCAPGSVARVTGNKRWVTFDSIPTM